MSTEDDNIMEPDVADGAHLAWAEPFFQLRQACLSNVEAVKRTTLVKIKNNLQKAAQTLSEVGGGKVGGSWKEGLEDKDWSEVAKSAQPHFQALLQKRSLMLSRP